MYIVLVPKNKSKKARTTTNDNIVSNYLLLLRALNGTSFCTTVPSVVRKFCRARRGAE